MQGDKEMAVKDVTVVMAHGGWADGSRLGPIVSDPGASTQVLDSSTAGLIEARRTRIG